VVANLVVPALFAQCMSMFSGEGKCQMSLDAVGCCWMSYAVVDIFGCHWMLLCVVGCHWMLLDVVGCARCHPRHISLHGHLMHMQDDTLWLTDNLTDVLGFADCVGNSWCWMVLDVVGWCWCWMLLHGVGCCWVLHVARWCWMLQVNEGV